MRLIGVDVGGTFTDVIFSDTETGQVLVHKVPTTGDDPSRGVVSGIVELCDRNGIDPGTIGCVFHGTTIATNAVLEYNGSEAGMVTTEGFRDIIHIGRHQRPQHYSIMQEIPWQNRPLVKRRHRKVVAERIVPPTGEVLVPLDEDGVRRAARELRSEGVEAVTVCFLFSYLNSAHEDRARELILEEFPEAFVTTSSSVVSQFREFERFTTAAMNAFIGPKVRNYVTQLDEALRKRGLSAELRIMRSNGGAATPGRISEFPVLTLLSGPAAGVIGGAWSGSLSDRQNVITFDVGGTSADIGVVTRGTFGEASARDTYIAGYPVLVPMIDIHTIGAGGGSIAHIDTGGTFRVGPRSAGSLPGPAAYGRGGVLPTVTDANVVLGRLDAENFLGGQMALDTQASHRVIAEIAERLGMSADETAEGIITILNSNMANAIRSRTVQKGIDPREYALMAFGGAGPLHGAEVAEMLGVPEVIVPAYPGITSALGLLTCDLKYDTIKTEFQLSTSLNLDRLNANFCAMEDELRAQFTADGVDTEKVVMLRQADARYVGQGYELRVDVADGILDAAAIAQTLEHFHQLHEAEYGHRFKDSPIEIVNIRLIGSAPSPQITWAEVQTTGRLEGALVKTGRTRFRVDGKLGEYDTRFYRRDLLPRDVLIPGPAIVLQLDTTTVVPPGWGFKADNQDNLILTKGAK